MTLFSASQLKILRAVADRIIPPDEYPGAWDAGVGDYLLGQFQRDLKHLLETYRAGLDALDAEFQASTGLRFVAASAETQDAILARIEQGAVVTYWPLDAAVFFKMLVEHCMEGYYSDPANGGNREGIAWQMIGFEVRDEPL